MNGYNATVFAYGATGNLFRDFNWSAQAPAKLILWLETNNIREWWFLRWEICSIVLHKRGTRCSSRSRSITSKFTTRPSVICLWRTLRRLCFVKIERRDHVLLVSGDDCTNLIKIRTFWKVSTKRKRSLRTLGVWKSESTTIPNYCEWDLIQIPCCVNHLCSTIGSNRQHWSRSEDWKIVPHRSRRIWASCRISGIACLPSTTPPPPLWSFPIWCIRIEDKL